MIPLADIVKAFENDRHVWVGFSGGADSTALLLRLVEALVQERLTAVHFHHGLRAAAADADAAWCQGFCEQRGLEFRLVHLDIPGTRQAGEGTEAAARRRRLEAWKTLVPAGDAVALGHHADDALEDFFLRSGRGSNASGLCGLRPRRQVEGVELVRPLLGCRRDELLAYLQKQGVDDWRHDATNQDVAHRRNAIRHRLLPLYREIFGTDAGLLQSLGILREEAEHLENEARVWAGKLTDEVQTLAAVPPALLPRTLRFWLRQTTGEDLVLNARDLFRLRDAMGREETEPPVKVLLSGGILLRFHRGRFRRVRELPPLLACEWHWRQTPELRLSTGASVSARVVDITPETDLRQRHEGFFDLEGIGEQLRLRPRHEGDAYAPLGRSTPEKLKRLFIEAEVPQEERQAIPVLTTADGRILWVPGVRRSNLAPAVPGRPALLVTYRPAPTA